MAKCPYCPYETPEPDDGDATTRGWQEVAHMTLDHPDILKERRKRLRRPGADPHGLREDDN